MELQTLEESLEKCLWKDFANMAPFSICLEIVRIIILLYFSIDCNKDFP